MFAKVILYNFLILASLSAGNKTIHSIVNPMNSGEKIIRIRIGNGYAPAKIFWRLHMDENQLEESKKESEKYRSEGMMTSMSLMMWGNVYGREDQNNSWHSPWVNWLSERQELWGYSSNGKPHHQGQTSFSGWVSPAVPMPEKDWPEGVKNATFGDWCGVEVGDFCARTGINVVSLADYYDGIPHGSVWKYDYNSRTLQAFADEYTITLPAQSVPELADFIARNYINEFSDFMNAAYAKQFARMAEVYKQQTNDDLIIYFQTAVHGVAKNRERGCDFRIWKKYAPDVQFMPRIELQADPGRGMKHLGYCGPKPAIFAGRDPEMIMGVQISAPEKVDPLAYNPKDSFWKTIDANCKNRLKLNLDSVEEKELFGYRFLKQHWFGIWWSHCLRMDGNVSRALSFWEGNYRNNGKPPEAIYEVIQNHHPVRPFGPGVYWSVNIEKALEKQGKTSRFDWDISELVEKGICPVYGISDITLPLLNKENAPSSFISAHLDLIPADERKLLEKIAPLVDYRTSPENIPSPIRFSDGATGFAFFNQDESLIVVAARPSSQWKDEVEGTITVTLEGLENGRHKIRPLIDGGKQMTLNVRNGTGTFTFHLDKYDCNVFEIQGVSLSSSQI